MRPAEQIAELEAQGYAVKVIHTRDYGRLKLLTPKGARMLAGDTPPSPKGGYTRVEITDKLRGVVGEAHCSRRDTFNKRLGVQIALGRAICRLTGEAARRAEKKEGV